MPEAHNQKAFHVGELAPNLYGRVDLAKYQSAAALMRNFFVDYRGGASTRQGTKYVLHAKSSTTPARLIPFTASFATGYMLEFGQGYIRFHFRGSTVVESAFNINGVGLTTPVVVGAVGSSAVYNTGDTVFISGVVGTTQINNRYFQIVDLGADLFQLLDLLGAPISGAGMTPYVSGGTVQRVYTIPSPYLGADLALLKFAQGSNGTSMVLTHPDYPPYLLTLIAPANWTLVPIQFGASIPAPTGAAATSTLAAGTVHYSYVVTAEDVNGQESGQSAAALIGPILDITTNPGTTTITWNAVAGALRYNVYKAQRSYGAAVPAGSAHGYCGTVTGTSFIDTNVIPDFSSTPPIPKNPFRGGPVASVTVNNPGTYTAVPLVGIAAPALGVQATAAAVLQARGTPPVVASANGNAVGDILTDGSGGLALVVATVDGLGAVLTVQAFGYPGSNPGSITSGATPANPVTFVGPGGNVTLTLTWGVGTVQMITSGSGYTAAPAVTFNPASTTAATAVLGAQSAGNPSTPAFHQQRLTLAGPTGAPQSFDMSQPGSYFNFDVSDPIQADDAISGSLVSNQVNEIKSMLSMQSGLMVLTSRQAWQISGGSAAAPITPFDVTAQGQAFNGASDVPPLLINYDILYVQSKGSSVRDLNFDFYKNVWTGTDISILSSHLFLNYQIEEWAYAEEPFKVGWAIRNDGTALSFTFLKEQELIGWAHSDTNGLFVSVATVTEPTATGNVDAVYFMVRRLAANGSFQTMIERMADRIFTYGVEDAWSVDAAVQTGGAIFNFTLNVASSQVGPSVAFITELPGPFGAGMVGQIIRMGGGVATITSFIGPNFIVGTITQAITAVIPGDPDQRPVPFGPSEWSIWPLASTFSGLEHLEGMEVTGTYDGHVIDPPQVVVNGSITLPGFQNGSKVTIGLAFTPQLGTLILDTGDPTIIGKLKKLPAITVRCVDTLGLTFGRTLAAQIPIKDFSGSLSAYGLTVPYQLVTADARQPIDPLWDQNGQFFMVQPNPLPATILAVVIEDKVEDKR